MSIKDSTPEIINHFVTTAKLFCALMNETNATDSKEETMVTHFESGKKYKAVLKIKQVK